MLKKNMMNDQASKRFFKMILLKSINKDTMKGKIMLNYLKNMLKPLFY